ncbi:MAG: glycosyltransferase family 4 protein [Gammaproteobacteria bacterium]|nr:glycosyltransferase family 4 protein [Gammaproteobacteria bacterium]
MRLTVMQLVPALEVGGVERGTVEVALALVRAGHRAIVVSAGGRLVSALEAGGAEHVSWPIGRKRPGTLAYPRRLRALIDSEKVDIVHARSRLPAWVGWRALRGMPGRGKPAFVTTVHGPYSVNRYSAIMARGDRVIAISAFIRDYILTNYPRLPPDRVVLIPRGIDPAEFPYGYEPAAEWRAGFGRSVPLAGRFVVTLPARITRWKGQAEFVEVVARLKARGIPVLGLLAGGAEPRRERFLRELESDVAARGLGGDVLFLGDRTDLREILALSDAAVSLTSEPEAFGRTTLEALSLGTPVVGFAHGGTAEILREIHPGGLCPPGDLDAVTDLLAALYAQPQRVAQQHAFTLATMLERTLALYGELGADQRS